MRVIYFSTSYTPHDHRFLSALANTPHRVYYLRLENEGRATERRPVPPNVEQVQWAGGHAPFHWRDVPRLAVDLRRVVRQIRPALIHAGPVQTCAFLSTLTGFHPILTMSWGFDLMQDADQSAWWRWVTRFTLRRSTFFTSDAEVTRQRAIAFGMDPDRTVVFPWGVDLKSFSPSRAARSAVTRVRSGYRRKGHRDPSRLSGGRDDFVILCNRSWEPRYGVDVLARAFAQAAKKNPRLNLILIGGGSQARVIRQILGDGDAGSRVVFSDHVPGSDMPRWYRMADVYVSPSHVDGSSVSLMEALACGVPSLVSDIPANREWIRHNVNGWLFADGDVGELTERILALAAGRGKFVGIRRAARALAVRKADWSKNFPVLLEAYEKAVKLN